MEVTCNDCFRVSFETHKRPRCVSTLFSRVFEETPYYKITLSINFDEIHMLHSRRKEVAISNVTA